MAVESSSQTTMQTTVDFLQGQNEVAKAALDPRLCSTRADNLQMELGSQVADGTRHTLYLCAPEHTDKAFLVISSQVTRGGTAQPKTSPATASRLLELGFDARAILGDFRGKCVRRRQAILLQAGKLEAAVNQADALLKA